MPSWDYEYAGCSEGPLCELLSEHSCLAQGTCLRDHTQGISTLQPCLENPEGSANHPATVTDQEWGWAGPRGNWDLPVGGDRVELQDIGHAG